MVGLHHILTEAIVAARCHHHGIGRVCSAKPSITRRLLYHHILDLVWACTVCYVWDVCGTLLNLRWRKARAVLSIEGRDRIFLSGGTAKFLGLMLSLVFRPSKGVKRALSIYASSYLWLLQFCLLWLKIHHLVLLLRFAALVIDIWRELAAQICIILFAHRCFFPACIFICHCAVRSRGLVAAISLKALALVAIWLLGCRINLLWGPCRTILTARYFHSGSVMINWRVNDLPAGASYSSTPSSSAPLDLHLLLLGGRQKRLLL